MYIYIAIELKNKFSENRDFPYAFLSCSGFSFCFSTWLLFLNPIFKVFRLFFNPMLGLIVCKVSLRNYTISLHTDKPPHGDRRFWGEGDGFTKYSQGHSQSSHKFSRAKRGDFFRAAPRARMRSSPARSAAIFQDPPPWARTRSRRREEEKKRREEEEEH